MWKPMQNTLWLAAAIAGALFLAGCPLFGDNDGDFGPCIGPGCVCTVTADCQEGKICNTGGVCVVGCRTDGDCRAGFSCGSDNECTLSTECTSNADCSGSICDFRGTCVAQPSGACQTDADCSGDDVCVEGFCRARSAVCQFNSDCGAGRACLNNRCSVVCGGGASCGPAEACVDGFCAPVAGECAMSDDCGPNRHCVDGRCFADCSGGGSCTETGSLCSDDDFCRPDIFPKPFCTGDTECSLGAVCRDGVCRTPCPSGNNTECLAADVQLPICGPDMLCLSDNEASPGCFAQADCSAGQSCVDAQCR